MPEWTITIEDQYGRPVVGTKVPEHWQHYSLEFFGNEEDRDTDAAGRVTFPKRVVMYPLIWRIPSTALAALSVLAHGSMGIDAYIIATEFSIRENFAQMKAGQPLPQKLVVTVD